MNNIWIKRFDFFNIQTSLSYKNEYFYSTFVGAVLTIITFFIILGVIGYEILLLCKKTSFTLISNQYTDLSQKIDFSKTPFLFELTNHQGQIIDILDKRLFSIEAYNMEMQIELGKDGSKIRKITNDRLELEKCNKTFLNKTEYSDLDLSRFICIKPGQNLTSYGILGDMNNPFKGIRIYINKCSGANCYDTSEIVKQLNNAKFIVTYLSLSSNIFYLNNENINYQLFSNYFSLSTNILKKIVFTYNIGRFYIYNNIAFKNKILVNYIIGNDYTIDIDLDPSSTIQNNEYTIATIAFNYGGKIMETRKEVQTIFESITIIGNFFNIILTIFKVINEYYANKILFVDIFKTLFIFKEKKSSKIKDRNNNFIKSISLNRNKVLNIKNKLDLSEQIAFNIKRKNSIKHENKKNILIIKRNEKMNDKNKKNIKNKYLYFYILPIWFIKRNKIFSNIYKIKDRICSLFSIEKMNELIKLQKILEEQSIKSEIPKTENITINNQFCKENYLNYGDNNIIKIIK